MASEIAAGISSMVIDDDEKKTECKYCHRFEYDNGTIIPVLNIDEYVDPSSEWFNEHYGSRHGVYTAMERKARVMRVCKMVHHLERTVNADEKMLAVYWACIPKRPLVTRSDRVCAGCPKATWFPALVRAGRFLEARDLYMSSSVSLRQMYDLDSVVHKEFKRMAMEYDKNLELICQYQAAKMAAVAAGTPPPVHPVLSQAVDMTRSQLSRACGYVVRSM